MSSYQILRKTLAFAVMAASVACAQATTTNINFDNTGAPSLFAGTSPLTTAYSALGVTFSGIDGLGGSILNQANFGLLARSGTDYLAFSAAIPTARGERITFDTLASSVSIWARRGQHAEFTLSAFNAQGQLLASESLEVSNDWQQLAVTASGIKSVTLTLPSGAFALDDFQFTTAVPEPESYGMMLAGLAALGLFGKRRRKTI